MANRYTKARAPQAPDFSMREYMQGAPEPDQKSALCQIRGMTEAEFAIRVASNPAPLPLLPFLLLHGGLRWCVELENIGAHQHFIPRLGMLVHPPGGSPVKVNASSGAQLGMPLHHALALAIDHCYLRPSAGFDELLDCIDAELCGRKSYPFGWGY